MASITLQRNNDQYTFFVHYDNRMDTIQTDIDGIVSVYDQLIDSFAHKFKETCVFDFTSKLIKLPYDAWYHLYQVIEQLLDDIFMFEMESSEKTTH